MLRAIIPFTVLASAHLFSRVFYRHHLRWIGSTPEDPWADIRLVVLLNHTSLFEWLFAGTVPLRFLWSLANHGVIPVADKTLNRPIVGPFFRLLGRNVVSVTRKPDETWEQLLKSADEHGMVLILPEGRMKRATGLDAHGQPLTVRGGVADILRAIPEGRMLMAYSGGLHHIQVPGQKLPNLFKPIYLSIENLDLAEYRAGLDGDLQGQSLKQRMKEDMERRKAMYAVPFDVD